MFLNKVVNNGYIVSVNNVGIGTEMTDEEYETIREALNNKPTKEGYGFKLKTDLTWEMFELPKEEITEATETDYINALEELGVNFNE